LEQAAPLQTLAPVMVLPEHVVATAHTVVSE
jgi:hypothetical protein